MCKSPFLVEKTFFIASVLRASQHDEPQYSGRHFGFMSEANSSTVDTRLPSGSSVASINIVFLKTVLKCSQLRYRGINHNYNGSLRLTVGQKNVCSKGEVQKRQSMNGGCGITFISSSAGFVQIVELKMFMLNNSK